MAIQPARPIKLEKRKLINNNKNSLIGEVKGVLMNSNQNKLKTKTK